MTESDYEPTLFEEEVMLRNPIDSSYLIKMDGYRVFGGNNAESYNSGKVISSTEASYLAENLGLGDMMTSEDRNSINELTRGIIKKPYFLRDCSSCRNRDVEFEIDHNSEDISDSF